MKCRICGREFDEPLFSGDCKDICSFECFDQDYWKRIVAEKDFYLFIDGVSYYLDDESATSNFRGFGGCKFFIRMKDTGRVIVTTNLWSQGHIPDNFKDELKDNAEFCKEEDFIKQESRGV